MEKIDHQYYFLCSFDVDDHLLDNDCNFDEWVDTMLKVLFIMYADDTVILAE